MENDLKDRTRDFSLRVIRLCGALRARSKAEYVAKMNGGLMELEETLYWIEIIEGAGLMTQKKLESIKTETDALIAIFVSLINKWRGK